MHKGLTGVEEHISDSCSFLVNFEGMTCQNDPFGDDASGVRIEKSSCGNEVGGWKTGRRLARRRSRLFRRMDLGHLRSRGEICKVVCQR